MYLSEDIFKALKPLALRYVWWKSANEALSVPEHALAHIMNLATFEDIQTLIQTTGEDSLKIVLKESLPGWFSEKSWHYWHYRLELSEPGHVPDLPVRIFL
jgi:hypothetical protein